VSAQLAWVVGRGGLLGHHVEAAFGAVELWRPADAVAWHDTAAAVAALDREAAAFLEHAALSGRPWRLLWCAGAGVVATPGAALAEETAIVDGFVAKLGERLATAPALARTGTLFLASSAGGVYAGSADEPPFDEGSPVCAVAPYGLAKLAQEELFERVAEACEVDLLIGRLSNLYGPGQNLAKPQGLVAHVGGAALRRQPVSIYVPLDTIRDYLFAADAGRMVAAAVERREDERRNGAPRETVRKIFASEVETTVASVLGTWRRVLRRPLRVALASDPVGRLQPRTLSFRSRVWPDLRGLPTPFHLGVDAVRRDQLARLLGAGLG
jgi:UDP-glucose 4-epimerase